MENSFRRFAHLLDAKHAVRLFVCVLPGLVISKLSTYAGAPDALETIGGITIIVGLGLYASWGAMRRRLKEDSPEEVNGDLSDGEQQDVSPTSVHVTIDNLEALYRNSGADFEDVLRQLRIEANLHPDNSLAAVIAEANHRRSYTVRNRSGS